jgi:hypothetical protein
MEASLDPNLKAVADAPPLPEATRRIRSSHLVWLGEALERACPNARGFIRPAFDEPDAVARFLAGKEGG